MALEDISIGSGSSSMKRKARVDAEQPLSSRKNSDIMGLREQAIVLTTGSSKRDGSLGPEMDSSKKEPTDLQESSADSVPATEESSYASRERLSKPNFFKKSTVSDHVRMVEHVDSSGAISDDENFVFEGTILDKDVAVKHSRRQEDYDLKDEDSNDLSSRSLMNELMAVPVIPTEPSAWKAYNDRSLIFKFRLFCGRITEEPRFQISIIVLIIVNAILMGVATFDFVTNDQDVDRAFQQIDRVFLIVFTVELVLQLVYRSVTYFTDAWLVFDFVIVVLSWSLESLQIVRAFRIFRAFRLVTRIGPLRELVMAIAAVMPRMYAIALLLILIFYIFAVLFTELFRDLVLPTNYFSSLDNSLFTCMELMTLEWAGITRDVMRERWWAFAPILSFLAITGFIVFNLIVAVVCDAVAVVDKQVYAEKHGPVETDTTRLHAAQERIWELSETLEMMMKVQREMSESMTRLATELEELQKTQRKWP